jgi:hypothetical protein
MKHRSYLFLLPLLLILLLIPANKSNQMDQEVGAGDHVVRDFKVELASMSRVEVRTRNSSVKVYTQSGGHGSGAYFLFEGHHVVFTVAHVVDEGGIYLIEDKWNNQRIGALVYKDQEKDFAIILIPEFKKTKPLKLKLPRYDIEDRVGSELVFSGFPTQHNLITVRGYVTGFEKNGFIMHAVAWMGSSGSCVFDKKGNLTGVLYAISVGDFHGEPTLIEDLVWVLPSDKINWEAARKSLRALD